MSRLSLFNVLIHLWTFPSNMKHFKQLPELPVTQPLMPSSLSVVCVQVVTWQIQLKLQGLILQQVEQSISSNEEMKILSEYEG